MDYNGVYWRTFNNVRYTSKFGTTDKKEAEHVRDKFKDDGYKARILTLKQSPRVTLYVVLRSERK